MKIFTKPIRFLAILFILSISFTSCLEERTETEQIAICGTVTVPCFEHVFPIKANLANETVVTLQNEEEYRSQEADIVSFVYPIEIIYNRDQVDELIVTIENEGQYEEAWANCRPRYNNNCPNSNDDDSNG